MTDSLLFPDGSEEFRMIDELADLHGFEEFVLIAVMRLSTNACRTTVHVRIARAVGKEVSMNDVDTALEFLEQKKYISSRQSEPAAERYYQIEASGIQLLDEGQRLLAMLERLSQRPSV